MGSAACEKVYGDAQVPGNGGGGCGGKSCALISHVTNKQNTRNNNKLAAMKHPRTIKTSYKKCTIDWIEPGGKFSCVFVCVRRGPVQVSWFLLV